MPNDYEQASLHVTFDTETTGLDPRVDEFKCVVFAKGSRKEALRHPEQREQIQKWLKENSLYFAHNACFDLAVLEQNGYTLPTQDRWRDTTLAAHLSGRRMPGQTKLDKIAKDFVKEEILPPFYLQPEENIKKWLSKARNKATREGLTEKPQKGHAPWEILEPYCIADVEVTQIVAHTCGSQIKGQEKIIELEHRVLPAIYHAQKRGAPINMDAARSFQVSTQRRLKKHNERVRELAKDEDFNPQATRQIESVLRMRGVDVDSLPKTPKSGVPKLDADTLKTIDDDFVHSLLDLREEKKFSDYADALFRFSHDGRLYGTFRQVGTTTGRMSSGEPNLQNLPRDERVRSIFEAIGFMVLVGADLDSVELRMLAHLAPGGEVERAFKDGLDLHQIAADGVNISRQDGKTLNYSILYGIGIKKLARDLRVSQERAKEILDNWYETFPEVHDLKNRIKWDLETSGYIETVLGRRHYIPADRHYIGLNYLIQGGCADLFKLAAAELHEANIPAILYVHDEIVLEVHEDVAEDAGKKLEAILTTGAGKVKGLEATANIGKKWSELK